MRKSRENPLETPELSKKDAAEQDFWFLVGILHEVEGDRLVDLNKPYGETGMTMGSAIRLFVDNIRRNLDDFGLEEGESIEKYLVKAEIYLSDYEPKKKK